MDVERQRSNQLQLRVARRPFDLALTPAPLYAVVIPSPCAWQALAFGGVSRSSPPHLATGEERG